MHRFVIGIAVTIGLLSCEKWVAASPDARSLPIRNLCFSEAAESCGNKCRVWVSAVGIITAETPFLFETFAKDHDLRGVSIALDSDGGSVLGAISLGRAIRRLGMITTVGGRLEMPHPL